MADREQAAREFWAGAIASLPEEKRTQALALLDDADATPLRQALGDGVLRQSDYSRTMDEIRTKEQQLKDWHQQLTDWHAEKKVDLDELDRLRATKTSTVKDPANPAPLNPAPLDPKQYLSREEYQVEIKRLESEALGAMVIIPDLMFRHYLAFGERLDPNTLLTHPKVREVGLEGVYQTLYKDRYDQKAKTEDEARTAKMREEIRAEERAKLVSHPYPVRPAMPSTLDALDPDKNGTSPYGPDAAALEYERLVNARLGGGGST